MEKMTSAGRYGGAVAGGAPLQFTEKDLKWVAERITDEWERIGTNLDIAAHILIQIKNTYPGQSERQAVAFMWHFYLSSSFSLEKLVDALQSARKVALAEEIKRKFGVLLEHQQAPQGIWGPQIVTPHAAPAAYVAQSPHQQPLVEVAIQGRTIRVPKGEKDTIHDLNIQCAIKNAELERQIDRQKAEISCLKEQNKQLEGTAKLWEAAHKLLLVEKAQLESCNVQLQVSNNRLTLQLQKLQAELEELRQGQQATAHAPVPMIKGWPRATPGQYPDNPGRESSLFGITPIDFSTVNSLVNDEKFSLLRQHWKLFGQQLGINPESLIDIERTEQEAAGALTQVLNLWNDEREGLKTWGDASKAAFDAVAFGGASQVEAEALFSFLGERVV